MKCNQECLEKASKDPEELQKEAQEHQKTDVTLAAPGQYFSHNNVKIAKSTL